MFIPTSLRRSFLSAAIAMATAALGSTSALARCAYVNSSNVPMFWCNPHKAEQAKDCQQVKRYVNGQELFYVLWQESPFLGQSMFYLKNVDAKSDLGWVYANRITIDDACEFKSFRKRARKR
jgi:hypothetical protein